MGFGMTDPAATVFTQHMERAGISYLVREKNLSSLALVEEVGLVGLFLFTVPLVVAVGLMLRTKRDTVRIFLLSYLAMLVLHAQIEGWWVIVGSYQLPFFFFAIGAMLKKSQ